MDYLFRLIVFLALFPFVAYADEYPSQWRWAVYGESGYPHNSWSELCSLQISLFYSTPPYTSCQPFNPSSSGLMVLVKDGGVTNNTTIYSNEYCPYGGFLNNHMCINAPTCDGGTTRNLTTGECEPMPPPECDLGKVLQPDGQTCACPSGEYQKFGAPDPNACDVPSCDSGLYVDTSVGNGYYACSETPPCKWPEVDNGFGGCEVKECDATEYRDVTTGNCEDTPQCAASETWSPSQSQCILDQLNCPGHSHANSTNDACLPDAPIACPEGQHDDGTYTCVADDAKGCAAGTQRGFIEGQLQCIPKHNIDLEQKESDDKQKAANDAAVAASAAAAAAKAAADAAAANPNDPALQQAAQAAAAAADAAAKAAQTAHDAAMRETSDATAKTLDDINQKIEEFTDPEPANDLIKKEEGKKLPNTEVPVTNTPIAGFSGGGSCLADRTLSVMGNSYTLSMAPVCDFASHIRPVILSIAGVLSVAIIATVI
jgi:hypothetical protein